MDDRRLRVCLDRAIELPEVVLQLRDWPGQAGPLVHVPDPLSPAESVVDDIAAALAPAYRVLSVRPRGGSPYQVDAADLLAAVDAFGFVKPVFVAERLGCVAALLVCAWRAKGVDGLVLIEPAYEPPPGNSLEARALRQCPPDWRALRAAVDCAVLVLARSSSVVRDLKEFLGQLGPGLA